MLSPVTEPFQLAGFLIPTPGAPDSHRVADRYRLPDAQV
jgi:hypothetical protein